MKRDRRTCLAGCEGSDVRRNQEIRPSKVMQSCAASSSGCFGCVERIVSGDHRKAVDVGFPRDRARFLHIMRLLDNQAARAPIEQSRRVQPSRDARRYSFPPKFSATITHRVSRSTAAGWRPSVSKSTLNGAESQTKWNSGGGKTIFFVLGTRTRVANSFGGRGPLDPPKSRKPWAAQIVKGDPNHAKASTFASTFWTSGPP